MFEKKGNGSNPIINSPTVNPTSKPTSQPTIKPTQSPKYGSVSVYLTYQEFRRDDSASVMLIPKNDSVKNFDNSLAAMLIPGEYESGIIVTECDYRGIADFDFVPVGEYILLAVFDKLISSSRGDNEVSWETQITNTFGKYFSDEEFETFVTFLGHNSLAIYDITVQNGKGNAIFHDFDYFIVI